jgi:peptide/nickel transport system substrate-binding protein
LPNAAPTARSTHLYWQAVSIMNPYLSGGTKDMDAASMVLEPLAGLSPEGVLVPKLVTEIPTVENGGVAAD